MLLTEEQKEKIESEYKDSTLMGEHGYMSGIVFMLEIIGESKFKDYLEDRFIVK